MRKTYDITPIMCELFDKVVNDFVLARDERGDKLNDPEQLLFETKMFEKHAIEKIYREIYKTHPFDANSKTASSTDVSPAKIRYIVNKT